MSQPDFLNRTRALLGQAALEKLGRSLVAIAGLGGVGGAAFMTMLRGGIKRFRLAENGIFDPPDMNRQWGALRMTMNRPKIEVYEEWARGINPEVELELFPEGVSVKNIKSFLVGSAAHIGAIDIDKGQDVKEKGEQICFREGIPLFTAGAIGFGAVMINHHPQGMHPKFFWELITKKSYQSGLLPSYLQAFFSPKLMKNMNEAMSEGKLATCSTGAGLAGVLLGTEVLNYLLRDTGLVEREVIFAPRFVAVDLMLMSLRVLDVTAD